MKSIWNLKKNQWNQLICLKINEINLKFEKKSMKSMNLFKNQWNQFEIWKKNQWNQWICLKINEINLKYEKKN